AGLRSGVPAIITPFPADQPFWGRRAAELGVGPTPIHRRRLTARNLAEAITRAVNDPEMRARAAVLGKKIRDENGVTHAVNVIEQHLHSH
ncbi:MAG: nucleotide disphospho-sugar-binding domain-containing protein, partial [Chloroflexota bacterium]